MSLARGGWILSILLAQGAAATDAFGEEKEAEKSFWSEVKESFSFELEGLSFATHTTSFPHSSFKPITDFLEVPEDRLDLHLRPRLGLQYRGLSAMGKPRWIGTMQWRQGYGQGGARTGGELFFNEWRIQLQVVRPLFVSYGREILQWGPSMFFSPSNPFFRDNGRSQPHLELGGRDFFRAVYVMNSSLTASLISNLFRGRGEEKRGDFERIHALKVDHTGQRSSASAMLWKEEGGALALAGHGQITVSDALLAYAEWDLERGATVSYPRRSPNPVGWEVVGREGSDRRASGVGLVGGSYTFPQGATLTLEYVYNSAGYGRQDRGLQEALAADLAALIKEGDERAGLALLTLGLAADPGLRVLGRHYLFGQILRRDIAGRLNVMLRYTHNLDEGSGLLVPNVECQIGRVKLFATAAASRGGAKSEIGRFLRYQAILGVRLPLA
jgi:hypothetical protein